MRASRLSCGRTCRPRRAPDDFVFMTPAGTPIDEANFQRRVWLRALRALRIRPRPFYNCRHTYISMLLDAGAKPLFVCRQTGTSLEMIEKHYCDARVDADQLDEMIRVGDREPTGNPPGCARRLAAVEGQGTLCVLRGSGESGRPGSNRRRPAWEAFLALVEQGFFGGGSRNRITQYVLAARDIRDFPRTTAVSRYGPRWEDSVG
jgi:hypothetical protein